VNQSNPQTFWLENLKQADRYNNWIFEQILPYLGNEVLEIGCGNGNFTQFLAQQCLQVTAIDINQEYVSLAKERLQGKAGVEILVADVNKMQWEKSFDTVIMLDVLEHIEDDIQLLRQLKEGIKPNGKLIIKVPALPWLYSPMDQAIAHYRRYNKKTLVAALEKASFTEPIVWYFNWAGIPGWWLNGKVLHRNIPPTEQLTWFNRLVPFLSTLERKFKPVIGLSLFAVAGKF
jgi:2-polyprenyl-3-methyl-5-hydroxy-6-metoxy-1,4-benzoquinol methylase